MARFLPVLTETKDERTVLLPSRPLTFEEFVKLFGEDEDVELVDGMVVKRMAAKDPHEDIGGWLLSLLRFYVGEKGLGIIRGSRTPVRITSHRGRLPDVLFARKERAPIVREEGIYEAPDLVVEILSPGDRPSDLIAMEADYRHIGVAEIWFVDQRRKLVRVLRKRDNRYEERVYRKGVVRSEVVEGFWVRGEWLFQKPLPKELPTLLQILGKA